MKAAIALVSLLIQNYIQRRYGDLSQYATAV